MIIGFIQAPVQELVPERAGDVQMGVFLLLAGLLSAVFFLVMRTYYRQVREQKQHQEQLEKQLDEIAKAGQAMVHHLEALSQQLGKATEQITDTIVETGSYVGGYELVDEENAVDSTPSGVEESPAVRSVGNDEPSRPDSEEEAVEKEPVEQAAAEEEPVEDESVEEEDPLELALHYMDHKEDEYPGNLLKACELLRPWMEGKDGKAASVMLAEALFWLGDFADGQADKERYHGEGVEVGKKAVALNPAFAPAHLWYAANMGSHGVARGIMSSLFYLGDIEKHGKKALELDETYFHAAPLRLLGRFYHQCPGWPIGKGDLSKAIAMLEQAVAKGPDFILNHYYLADALVAKRKKADARKVLREIIAIEHFQEMPKYQQNLQDSSRMLLKKI